MRSSIPYGRYGPSHKLGLPHPYPAGAEQTGILHDLPLNDPIINTTAHADSGGVDAITWCLLAYASSLFGPIGARPRHLLSELYPLRDGEYSTAERG
jgi:hypothetical protein